MRVRFKGLPANLPANPGLAGKWPLKGFVCDRCRSVVCTY